LIIVNNAGTTTLKHSGTGDQKFWFGNKGDVVLDYDGESVLLVFEGSYWYLVGEKP